MSRVIKADKIKNMEKEPKIKSLEDTLRERGYTIKPYGENAAEWAQCEKEGCFEDAGWFIEGNFYCPRHKGEMLKILEKIEEDVKRRKLEQERVVEERRKINKQAKKRHLEGDGNPELRERLEQKREKFRKRREGENKNG